jgi:hypothetical protein
MSEQLSPDIATHLNYHDGMFLTSAYMTLEQSYFTNWITLQNKYLYTPGVLQGMKEQSDTTNANALTVDAGVGFDEEGHFLIFPGPVAQLVVPSGTSNPFAVFAVYNTQTLPDTVNQAAVLAIAAPGMPPANSVLLANCGFNDNGQLLPPTDARVPVNTRLPATLSDNVSAQRLSGNLDAAKRGQIMLDIGDLIKPGMQKSVQIYFSPQKNPVFSAPPLVHATVQGATAFAIAVSSIDTRQFLLTVTSIQTMTADNALVQINWLAFPN